MDAYKIGMENLYKIKPSFLDRSPESQQQFRTDTWNYRVASLIKKNTLISFLKPLRRNHNSTLCKKNC